MLPSEPLVWSATRAKTAYKIRELVHNFWIEKTSQIHLQVRGHACCLVFHVSSTAFCHLSKIEIKSGCRSFQAMQTAKKARPNTAAHSSTQTDTTVKPEKRPAVALYLDELLIKYVNSEVDRSSVSHNGFPPGGSMAPCRSHHGKHT